MEHESFEDEDVAKLMNDTFVCIKVDREERPDIDNVYMEITQMMNKRGGWPMTVVMTPDKKPFFSGTYFPKFQRGRRIGMMELIPRIHDAWKNNNDSLVNDANQLTIRLNRNQVDRTKPGEINKDILDNTFKSFKNRYDKQRGGFGRAPKFPKAHDYSFLIKYWKRTGEKEALDIAEHSLLSMRNGGIFDQIGFGFHRYSIDANWLVPHFEKMLYDQAILIHAYLDAYQATKEKKYSIIVEEILEYVLRDMTSDNGGFYSAEDADSQGEEGKFYVWRLGELNKILSSENLALFKMVYNIKAKGNWKEGLHNKTNIPHLNNTIDEISKHIQLSKDIVISRLDSIRKTLFEIREKRVHPQKDDKILTDWNGLMISAMARAGSVLRNDRYQNAAVNAMDFVLNNLYKSNGKLLKRSRNGVSGLTGVLDDYAFTIWGLIELYQMNYDEKYLERAIQLSEYQIDQFWDFEKHGFFFTAKSGEKLLARTKEIYDGAIPSGNSVSAFNFIRLSRITSIIDFENIAFQIFHAFAGSLNRSSSSYSMMVQAIDFAYGPSYEVLVFGDEKSDETINILNEINSIYMPNRVIVFGKNGTNALKNIIPFINLYPPNKDGSPQVYVCQNFSCKLPTSNINDIRKQLGVID